MKHLIKVVVDVEPHQARQLVDAVAWEVAIDDSGVPAELVSVEPGGPVEGEFVLLHVWGDESGIYCEDTKIVPPDGRLLNVGLPNSHDVLVVARKDLLEDQSFLDQWIPEHLHEEARDEAG